jgi:ureidoacrylate peracid hydrolase
MAQRPFPPIGSRNTALVIHDFQYDFVGKHLSESDMQFKVKRTKELIDAAHRIRMPVIYTRVETDPAIRFPEGREAYLTTPGGRIFCEKGTRSAEIIDELKPMPADFVITKVKFSAFYGTPLETLIRVKGIWIFLILGGTLNRGVEFLGREAIARDIVNVLIEDLTHSATPSEQTASLANFKSFLGYVAKSDEMLERLNQIDVEG